MQNLLHNLNPEQLAAVTLPAQSALILAGAGSGKTRVLTTRIAWLIQTGQISPNGILAVTFTNKASKEMRSRLSAMMPINTRSMWIGTFHGLCNRLLRAQSIDLAVAVEIDDGVLTPVIRGVEKLSLAQLTIAFDQLIDRARAGRVSDAGSAVATISNYGTFGLTWATPIPLPGQASILGIGSVENVPEWDPAIKGWGRARQAELTLTFDHRIADGGAAGRLLHQVADLLEHPEKL